MMEMNDDHVLSGKTSMFRINTNKNVVVDCYFRVNMFMPSFDNDSKRGGGLRQAYCFRFTKL